MEAASKQCTKCSETKLLSEFHKDKRGKLGFRSDCKTCQLELKKRYYDCNNVSIRAKRAHYREGNKDKCLKYARQYARNRRATDPTYRAHVNYRKLSKRYWTSDSRNVADHRLVSKETYSLWINYQQQLNDAPDNYHLDERWPQSKFDLDNPYHRLVATNVINYCPLDPIENIKKSNKIIPKLLLDQVEIANRFLLEVELLPDERIKFKFLTMMYSNFVKYQLVIVLKDSNIAI